MELALLEWTDDLKIGIDEIDKQHIKLIGLINKLTNSLITESEKESLESVIDELFRYIQTHFGYEERIFDQINYSLKQEHKKEHLEFELKIKASFAQVIAGTPDVAKELNRYLVGWIFKHIMISDHTYFEEFKKNGFA